MYESRIFNCTIPNVPDEVFNVKYKVGIIDIPWSYANPRSNRPELGGYTFDVLTVEELIKFKPFIDKLFDSNSIVFSWGTWPKLVEFEKVRQAWEFEHITGLPWIKVTKTDKEKPNYLNTGYWLAGCSEYCCIWRRGKVSPPKNTNHYLGLIAEGGFKHSKKPQSVHEIAEELDGPYIELFGRQAREGWTIIGNDIQKPTMFVQKGDYENFDFEAWVK